MNEDLDEPAIFIYDNPDYIYKEEVNLFDILASKEGKEKLKDELGHKINNLEKFNIDSVNNFEIEILSLLGNFSNYYEENQKLYKTTLKNSLNIEIKRSCLIHLLGGGTLATHFFNIDGEFKNDKEFDNEILELLSYKGVSLKDYFLQKKIWLILDNAKWLLFQILMKAKFIWNFLLRWYKKLNKNKIPIASASITCILGLLYLIKERFENNIYLIAAGVLFSICIFLYEAFFSFIEIGIIHLEINHYTLKGGLTDNIKKKINLFKKEYILYDYQIKELIKLPDEEIEKKMRKSINNSEKDINISIFLKKYLKKTSSLNEIYLELRNNSFIIPLAVYFFNHRGELRSVRELICSIIIMTQNFKLDKYSNLIK